VICFEVNNGNIKHMLQKKDKPLQYQISAIIWILRI